MAAAASRSSNLTAVRQVLVIVEALIAPVPAVAPRARAEGKSRPQDSGLQAGHRQGKSRAQDNQSLPAAAMPSGMFNRAKLPTPSPHVGTRALAAAVLHERAAVVVVALRERAAAVAGTVVVAAADDDQTSCSSTTSFLSAGSTTELVSIASAIMAAIALMSA